MLCYTLSLLTNKCAKSLIRRVVWLMCRARNVMRGLRDEQGCSDCCASCCSGSCPRASSLPQARDPSISPRPSHSRVDSVRCLRMASHSRNASQSRRANDSENESILGAVIDVPTPVLPLPTAAPTNSLTRHASSRPSAER